MVSSRRCSVLWTGILDMAGCIQPDAGGLSASLTADGSDLSWRWSDSDRTRSQTLSDQMDVVARPWSWTKDISRGQSSPTGGREQPKERRRLRRPSKRQNNFSTYRQETDGVGNFFIETEQWQIYTYYQTNIFKLLRCFSYDLRKQAKSWIQMEVGRQGVHGSAVTVFYRAVNRILSGR